ncbi:uncharacterized protein PV09_09118 [Verruconis gallopava]|uniref:Uncharacterized protein n=1 Tax=Verruconis gallopava TaxID=253628 RepID=A0A0D2AJP9_9PEZI|nr:uncharacterized protein PV09_09118 [Verruconis gallopava]KIV99163.1 hypothetical protein PV09_09118 [Verruconis gallopava]
MTLAVKATIANGTLPSSITSTGSKRPRKDWIAGAVIGVLAILGVLIAFLIWRRRAPSVPDEPANIAVPYEKPELDATKRDDYTIAKQPLIELESMEGRTELPNVDIDGNCPLSPRDIEKPFKIVIVFGVGTVAEAVANDGPKGGNKNDNVLHSNAVMGKSVQSEAIVY